MGQGGIIRRMRHGASAALAGLALLCLMTACSQGGVPVRDSLEAYSWEELASMSAEISQAEGDEALAIAKRYRLADEGGRLDAGGSKSVALADGGEAHVALVGLNQDVREDGATAGMTFAFLDAVGVRSMNNNAGFDELSSADDFDAAGGWPACELRDWLNGDFVGKLPDDLRNVLADVEKPSCVVPQRETVVDDAGALLTPASSLIATSVDKLWLPSVVELTGVSDASPAAGEYPEWTSVLRSEGAQYQLFADAGVSETEPNELLARSLAGDGEGKPRRWWLRSVEEWTFASVMADGSVDRREHSVPSGTAQAVVPFFAV